MTFKLIIEEEGHDIETTGSEEELISYLDLTYAQHPNVYELIKKSIVVFDKFNKTEVGKKETEKAYQEHQKEELE